MGEFFFRIYNLLSRRKRVFLWGLILLFGLLAWTASSIRFDEDISKLIPQTSENEALQKVLKTVQFADKIIVHLKKSQLAEPDDLTDYALQFLDSLSPDSNVLIKDVQGQVEDETIFETMDFVYDHIPLFLKKTDYNHIAAKLPPDSITKIIEKNYKTLISPSGIVAKKTLVKDPLGISLIALKHLQSLGMTDDFTLKDGFLISKDEQHLLIFITPEFPSNNTTENALLSEQLYNIHEHLNQIYKGKVMGSLFGGALIAVANAKQIKNDIQVTVTIAMALLMTVFMVFYKKLTIPIILFVPTLFGGLLALAFLSILRSEISTISLGIGAVLLGVTLDYSLHILTHIRNKETAQELFSSVSTPILMSSITTALAFLCLIFLDARALQDLGIFAAISVLGASIFALIFIPQIYQGVSENHSKTSLFDQWALYPFHKNKVLLGGIVVLLVISAFTYHRVVFNNDISNLNFHPKAITSAEAGLDTLINISSKSLYAVAYGSNEQQVLETNDSIFEKLQQLDKEQMILSFNSVAALLNSDKKQRTAIQSWDDFWTSERKRETENNLISNGEKFGFKSSSFDEFYKLLNQDFQPLSSADYTQMKVLPIHDFVAKTPDFMTVTSVVTVDEHQMEEVKESFEQMPHMMLIDRQAVNETLLGHVKNDFNRVLVYCFIAVVLLLLLFYKNLKLTIVTVVPIILTWFITIGIMGLFHLEFNIFNIIISTFIFGLGVDYSIFMTNGMRSGVSSLKTHKTSIILSVLTTVMGVGVLIFAKHPALHSLATISVIGIISAMVVTFTLQPILYKKLIRRGNHFSNDV